MDLYRRVRLACAEGMSQREAARHFGISRDGVRKMMAFSVPPGYRRKAPVKRPKLDGFTGIIDAWLEEDRSVPRKQRHTAKRVLERLRDEHSFTGGYTIVKDYVREHDRRGREMFVPLTHPPGHAQADFGEAMVIIGGIEQKAHFFAFDLPHSDACYIRAYARRNFMVPVPRFHSWKAFNAWLEEQCRKRQGDILRGHAETIGQRLARDLDAMAELPPAAFDACDPLHGSRLQGKRREGATGRVNSQALVRYKTNDYSVPVAYHCPAVECMHSTRGATAMSGYAAMSTRWRSAAAAMPLPVIYYPAGECRHSPRGRAVMIARMSSSTRSTTSR